MKIATLVSNPSRSPLFAYELGSVMPSGLPAPGRRLGMFLGDLTASNLTAEGLRLFEACVQWAIEEPVFDENGPPVVLRYQTSPAVYNVDVQITPNAPSSLGGAVTNYSIIPSLPPGLVLDPVTGVISGKPRLGRPPVTYQVTASNAVGSATQGLVISVQGPPPGDVLLVVGNLTLNSGDSAIRDWFIAGGYGVVLRTLTSVQVGDTANMKLVMITSTGSSAQIGSRLRDVAVPVIVCEPYILGNMGMTLPGNDVNMGIALGETQVDVIQANHPLSSGLSGPTTVANIGNGFLAWGVPGGDAITIATLATNPSRATVFAYDSGSLLAAGDTASHRRLGMFLGDVTAANFTLQGSWLFAAGVQWAIEGVYVEPEPLDPPVALSYPTNPATYQVGGVVNPNVPTSQGGAVQSYSITPALPAGLVFNTTTGVISGTPSEIRAAAPYQVTASNEDGSASVTLTLSVPGPPEVMLVVGSLTLNTGDAALRNWFLTRGYIVTLRTFAAAQAADATGKNLVVVSSTGTSSQLGGRLTNVAVPVIVCESFIFDDMGMTAVDDGVQLGTLNTQSQIQIITSGHPLAAGLSGLTTVVGNSAGFFNWGVPGSAAVNVATLASNPARSTLFAYESGSLLVSGQPAAHRRLGLFLGDFTAANFTASGSQIFEACVQWAVGQR